MTDKEKEDDKRDGDLAVGTLEKGAEPDQIDALLLHDGHFQQATMPPEEMGGGSQ